MAIKDIIKLPLRRIKWIVFMHCLKCKLASIHNKGKKCIVFISTPMHGNLGDQAIVFAQYKYFSDNGFGNQIVEITTHEYSKCKHRISEYISPDDIIIIDGGGNMGTLWIEEEHKMRDIVKRFPDNRILIFPQTVYYDNDSFGNDELNKSVRIYNRHRDLHICARELTSYQFMKSKYDRVDILSVPDMVLYLKDVCQSSLERQGAIFCFRSDNERVISNEQVDFITRSLEMHNINIVVESTVASRHISSGSRKDELLQMWKKFARAQIVVTDRLHAMIFAAITNTPCIAFDNKSNKVEGVYEWIKYLSYIKFIRNIEEVETCVENLLDIGQCQYDNSILQRYFDELRKRL